MVAQELRGQDSGWAGNPCSTSAAMGVVAQEQPGGNDGAAPDKQPAALELEVGIGDELRRIQVHRPRHV